LKTNLPSEVLELGREKNFILKPVKQFYSKEYIFELTKIELISG
jgi:hypothetical protein